MNYPFFSHKVQLGEKAVVEQRQSSIWWFCSRSQGFDGYKRNFWLSIRLSQASDTFYISWGEVAETIPPLIPSLSEGASRGEVKISTRKTNSVMAEVTLNSEL